MTYIDLRRRLDRIETGRGGTVPTRIMADRPMDDAEASAALANWRSLVADGRASVGNGILCLVAPQMTMEAWEALHATERERLH